MNKITGAEFPLKDIFSERFDFEIPYYQRPYAWTTEQAGDLFDDLYEFKTRQDIGDAYFLGSIVLIKRETEAKSDVIDGQQRLTTLTILLAAIKSRLSGNDAQEFATYVNEPGKRVEGLEPKPRLALRERDREFFKKYVQDFRLDELILLDPATLTDSRQNMHTNAKLFLDKLEETFGEDQQKIFDFGSFIVNRCYLVSVSTPSMKSAYRIFSVLNDRGLDLLPSDMLKADVIGRLPEDRKNYYAQKWEDLEEDLGRKNFSDLFAHIRMILQKSKSKATILEELEETLLADNFNSEIFIDKILVPYADAYRTILNADYLSTRDPAMVNMMLRWLQRIDNSDWIPPAILFLSMHANDLHTLGRFFTKLERLAASLFLQRAGVNERIERYSEVIRQIESGNDFSIIGGPLELSTEDIKKTLDVINGNVYLMSKRPRTYLLLRLDSWLADSGAVYDHKILTVEHVLPQTVPDGSYWAQKWPDQKVRDKWLHKLGNLLLLSRQKNSEAQNYDFLKKKEKYFTGRSGVSSFAVTTTVLDQDDWTEQVVVNRQDELIRRLISGWNLVEMNEST